MDDLSMNLSLYIKKANEAMTVGDYRTARENLIHAAECTLLLAKQSPVAAKRDKHLATYQSLKAMLQQLEIKMGGGAAAPKAPAAPAAPTAPKAPTAPFTPPTPGAGMPFNVPPKPQGGMPFVVPSKPGATGGMPFNVPPKPQGGMPFNVPPKAPTPGTPMTPEAPNTPPTPKAPPEQKKTPAGGERNDALSPRTLDDYIGQPGAVKAVRDLIVAARLKNAALPHLIVYGSHGLGKTTFGKIIANELNVGFTEVNVTKITPNEMIAILTKLRERDILFIDEIHTLPLVVAESILYSAMQDGRITYTEGKGKFARTITTELPHFTLIGATTEIGKLAKPFIQRAIQVRLEEYTDEVLAGIIKSSFKKLGMIINDERALVISKRCRNNPRIANNTVKRISDKALVRYAIDNNLNSFGAMSTPDAIRKLNIEISDPVIYEFFEENGIDEWGLESGDRALLDLIINRYKGGPVGLDTLARALNEANNVIAQKYEAYLIKKGLMRIDRDGRVAMPDAYKVLGLPVPDGLVQKVNDDKKEDDQDKENNVPPANNTPPAINPNPPINHMPPEKKAPWAKNEKEDEEKRSKYEKRTVAALPFVEELKCEKVEALIVYPENTVVVENNLDELFPDVEKPYESDTVHACELDINFRGFTRNLICDSFLESKFAQMLAQVGYVTDIKAQTLEIPYISQELANRRYFPDFVIKDYKGRVAVIEMKNFEMMSYHLNIDKYEHLRRYCEALGYGYAEIMKEYNAETYVSVEMLRAAPVNEHLMQYIYAKIEENGVKTGEGMFSEADFDDYKREFGEIDRKEIYTILLNDRRLKNTDRGGKSFRIIMNE